jgi:hypothetical protein
MNPDDQPIDPIGTVRKDPDGGGIAVRGYSDNPANGDDHIWYVINTGGDYETFPDIGSWSVVLKAHW